MNAALLSVIASPTQVVSTPVEGCVSCGEQPQDGTGAHLQLQTPWWNDKIHELTDTTWFRWLLVYIVIDWIIKKLR